ncbi:hypothetical protein WJX75_007656 [Coccomyxa subellipsoidea]|uniref:Nucleotide-sugar transporter n=1 Tax=Coccomyxa subellipsoidea TaxID=248742 RepID=A0ABR2YCF2_9CHLO
MIAKLNPVSFVSVIRQNDPRVASGEMCRVERANGIPPLHPRPPPSFSEPSTSKTALAYAEPLEQATARHARAWKVWLVAGDCFLIGLAPVLVHMSKGPDGKFPFHPVSINLLVEVAKTIFATVVLMLYGTGRPGPPLYRSARAFVRDARHNQLLAVPAGLYAINNYLKFAMQLFFKPTTAKMLGNLKILVIAVLMKWVLKRTFSVFQWEALLLLVAGITVNQLNYCKGGSDGDMFSTVAIAYTLGSVTVPSLASVYNEFALKKHMDTSVHEQNFFLYFYGALFNLLGVLATMAFGGLSWSAIFHGHSKVTMLLVMNNALQGILSSFFFKYADTILKKYSSTVATIFTGIMSAALFGHQLTLNFLIGVTIVFISMHQFFAQGGVKGATTAGSKVHSGGLAPFGKPLHFTPSPSLEHLRQTSDSDLASLDGSSGVFDPEHAHAMNARRPLLPR